MGLRPLIVNRLLQRAEDLVLFFCFIALVVVETGYVVWLERLPALPAPPQAESPFLELPPWYGKPRVEVTLLLAVAGGILAWTALGLIAFFHHPRRTAETALAHRAALSTA